MPQPLPDCEDVFGIGDVLDGKYRIESFLGSGGMGVVYAAVDESLNRPVAIKALRTTAAEDSRVVTRFLREARAAAAIQNDHVVRVYGVGKTQAGLPFIVMERLWGEGLDEAVRRHGPFSVRDAVDLALEACRALAHAHSLGIIHRDIKPANLFLSSLPDGSHRLKVLDFGISKLGIVGNALPDLTSTVEVFGTPTYMSPEQARSSKEVTPATDIWSLGEVLYELLCGAPPFQAETFAALISKIVADAPPRPSQVRHDLPVPLENIILRCLEKLPERRPASIGELARSLRPFASDRGADHADAVYRSGDLASLPTAIILDTSGVTPAPTTLPRWIRRHRGLVGASVVVTLCTALGVWFVFHARLSPQTSVAAGVPTSSTTLVPPPGIDSAVAVEPRAADSTESAPEPIPPLVRPKIHSKGTPPKPSEPVAPEPKHDSTPAPDPFDRF